MKKDVISLGDNWTVYADGEQVAEIKGSVIPMWGDTYVMTDNSGNVLGTEAENVKVVQSTANRFDESGQQVGSYEQEMFSLAINIRKLDNDGVEQGKLDGDLGISFYGSIDNKDGIEEFNFNKKVLSIGSDVIIDKVNSDNKVEVMDAIWMTAIGNEIYEAESDSSSSSSSRSR